jgi:hypothetical protein
MKNKKILLALFTVYVAANLVLAMLATPAVENGFTTENIVLSAAGTVSLFLTFVAPLVWLTILANKRAQSDLDNRGEIE